MKCAKCQREVNSIIHGCPLCCNEPICMVHCPACIYFAGTQSWQCRYKRQPEAQKMETRAEKAVTKFRMRMAEIDKTIKHKGGDRT